MQIANHKNQIIEVETSILVNLAEMWDGSKVRICIMNILDNGNETELEYMLHYDVFSGRVLFTVQLFTYAINGELLNEENIFTLHMTDEIIMQWHKANDTFPKTFTYQGIFVTLGQTFVYTFMSGAYYQADRHVICTDCEGRQYDARLAYVRNEYAGLWLDDNTVTLQSNAQGKSYQN